MMKVAYRANGEVRELSDEAGAALVGAGICAAVTEPPKKDPTPKKPATPDKSTKVEPLTTEDMPVPPKKVA